MTMTMTMTTTTTTLTESFRHIRMITQRAPSRSSKPSAQAGWTGVLRSRSSVRPNWRSGIPVSQSVAEAQD